MAIHLKYSVKIDGESDLQLGRVVTTLIVVGLSVAGLVATLYVGGCTG